MITKIFFIFFAKILNFKLNFWWFRQPENLSIEYVSDPSLHKLVKKYYRNKILFSIFIVNYQSNMIGKFHFLQEFFFLRSFILIGKKTWSSSDENERTFISQNPSTTYLLFFSNLFDRKIYFSNLVKLRIQ